MSEWDEHAAHWDDDPSVRAYAAAVFESLIALLGEGAAGGLDGASACDFGCGTGLLTERLVAAGAQVDAVDSSPAMLDVLRAKVARRDLAGVRVLERLPDGGPTYDLVVCSSVLAFVDDARSTTASLVDRLAPGGWFVQWDWELVPTDPEPWGFTREQIAGALRGAGLADVRVEVAFEVDVDGAVMRPLMGSGRRA